MKVSQATPGTVGDVWADVETVVKQSSHLETAAQALTQSFYDCFTESVVIVRVFVTVPFGELPFANRSFVEKLADSAGRAQDLNPQVPVLSLLGTFGQEPDWTDRRLSKRHVGIPLISSSFIGSIPMISRLLKELGVSLDWVERHDREMIIRTMGRSAGLFFVEDASGARDSQGRDIIAEQDFVLSYDIKTVFGTGGAYPNGQIVILVVFCRDRFDRTIAEQFLSMTNLFMSQTAPLAASGRIFLPS